MGGSVCRPRSSRPSHPLLRLADNENGIQRVRFMGTFSSNPKNGTAPAAQPRFGRIDLGLEHVAEGIERAKDWLLSLQHPDGYWCGELEADSMLESDYIFVHTLRGTGDRGRMERAVNEILRHQNEDGG